MSGTTSSGEGVLTIPEALTFAMDCLRAGDGQTGETVVRRILAIAPDHPDALHLSGLIAYSRGDVEEALRLIRRSLEIEPDAPSAHVNFGNILKELGQHELAREAYGEAIALDPENAEARNNLALVFRTLRNLPEAERLLREAVKLNPGYRDAWNNLGHLLSAMGRPEDAIDAHLGAYEAEPRNAGTRAFLIVANAACKRIPKAIEIAREWIAEEPDHPQALHLHASLTGENVPDRASDAYVQNMFDSFSRSFDERLAKLEYRAPQLVGQAVGQVLGEGRSDLQVLDAGCGTGLCGPFLKPFAARLVGVDLSAGMLAKARARTEYDDLHHAELTRYLHDHPASYDLVVSADTLCYFGALDEVAEAAAGSLRAGGRLFFTVEERAGDDGFRLNENGRYSHTAAHIRAALERAGFEDLRLDKAHLRMECAVPVDGLVVSARKPG